MASFSSWVASVNGLAILAGHGRLAAASAGSIARCSPTVMSDADQRLEVRPAQRLLGGVHDGFGLVPSLDQEPRVEVGLGVLERLDEHALHLVIGEAVGRLHLDRLLDTRCAARARPR